MESGAKNHPERKGRKNLFLPLLHNLTLLSTQKAYKFISDGLFTLHTRTYGDIRTYSLCQVHLLSFFTFHRSRLIKMNRFTVIDLLFYGENFTRSQTHFSMLEITQLHGIKLTCQRYKMRECVCVCAGITNWIRHYHNYFYYLFGAFPE